MNDVHDVRDGKIDCEVIAGHVLLPPPASTLCVWINNHKGTKEVQRKAKKRNRMSRGHKQCCTNAL